MYCNNQLINHKSVLSGGGPDSAQGSQVFPHQPCFMVRSLRWCTEGPLYLHPMVSTMLGDVRLGWGCSAMETYSSSLHAIHELIWRPHEVWRSAAFDATVSCWSLWTVRLNIHWHGSNWNTWIQWFGCVTWKYSIRQWIEYNMEQMISS